MTRVTIHVDDDDMALLRAVAAARGEEPAQMVHRLSVGALRAQWDELINDDSDDGDIQ